MSWILIVLAAAAAAFLVGGLWYGVLFGRAAAALNPAYGDAGSMRATTIAFELVRCVLLAVALAILARWSGAEGVLPVLGIALVAWVGFQAAGLAGAVVHEGYPSALYAIHAGDALAKALVAGLVIALLAPAPG